MAKASLLFGRIYTVGGKVPVTESRCCCGDFPGAGWYCQLLWTGSSCETLTCTDVWTQHTVQITTAEEWAAYVAGWGVCTLEMPPDNYRMVTSDMVRYETQEAADAGCACP